MSNKLDKIELEKLAEILYQSAFHANAYYSIIMRYQQFSKKYTTEMNASRVFYQTVYVALQSSCLMEIAKLYDKSKGSVSIGTLLKHCEEHKEFFPEYSVIETIDKDGKKCFCKALYPHYLKPTEECFYKNEVKNQREIRQLFDIPDFDEKPTRVDLTFSQLLELYTKRFNSLSKKRKNICFQRNKIYAHNDKEHILAGKKVWETHPITYPDIQELIDFALDCTRLILCVLTGVGRAENYEKIDDWEATLMLTKLGLKYQDYEMEQQHKQILNADKKE